MKPRQLGPALVLTSFFLSAVLHAALITGVSGVKVPWNGLLSPKIFFARIVTEGPPGGPWIQSSEESLGGSSEGSPKGKGKDKEQGNASGEGDGNREIPASGEPVPDSSIMKEGEVTKEDERNEVASLSAGNSEDVIPPRAERTNPRGLMNHSRENFYFDIYWLGIYVGKASLEAVNAGGAVKISSQVHSARLISAIYKVEDYGESRLINGAPSHFSIRQREGKYRSDKETVFDMESRKVIYSDHLKGTRAEHDITEGVPWDVMSGFYFLRTLSLEVGKTLSIDIFDSNKFYTAEVTVIRKDKIKLPGRGEQDVVIVKPVLKSEGLFQNKGDILIWLTDDENRIPVRIETSVPIGTVTAELTKLEIE